MKRTSRVISFASRFLGEGGGQDTRRKLKNLGRKTKQLRILSWSWAGRCTETLAGKKRFGVNEFRIHANDGGSVGRRCAPSIGKLNSNCDGLQEQTRSMQNIFMNGASAAQMTAAAKTTPVYAMTTASKIAMRTTSASQVHGIPQNHLVCWLQASFIPKIHPG